MNPTLCGGQEESLPQTYPRRLSLCTRSVSLPSCVTRKSALSAEILLIGGKSLMSGESQGERIHGTTVCVETSKRRRQNAGSSGGVGGALLKNTCALVAVHSSSASLSCSGYCSHTGQAFLTSPKETSAKCTNVSARGRICSINLCKHDETAYAEHLHTSLQLVLHAHRSSN